MPMVYVSKETSELMDRILKFLQEKTRGPGRVLKADVIHQAIEEYAEKLGLTGRG